MKKIIFVADDFALTKGVNKAIIELYKKNIIKHTALLANSDLFKQSVNLLKKYPDLEISCHLSATFGKPLLNKVNSLIDDSGKFIHISKWHKDMKINQDELLNEFEAQIQRILKAGLKIRALNCHHNIQTYPFVKKPFLQLAKKYHLPIRNIENKITKDEYQNIYSIYGNRTFYLKKITLQEIQRIINDELTKHHVVDIQTHPGYVDHELLKITSYAKNRGLELAILGSPRLKKMLKENNVEIINYQNITEA